jgi:hypothetical protein
MLKIKRNEEFKTRWVIGGYQQRQGIDYHEVYAAVTKSMFIRVLLALAVIHDLEIEQLDVMNAFLNADLKETLYMEMSYGFVKKGYVCLLLKIIYGLHQSSRE